LSSNPHFSHQSGPPGGSFRINGKIRAREVRVINSEGKQIGILPLADAIVLARQQGMDLVEIAPNATPPVCRIVDYGKFRYEQAKREKDSRKHQHASRVKEVQLSPNIDPHDFGVKRNHAIGFLCDDMKVKVTLKFRGREMAHQEIGFQVVRKFIESLAPWGHPDFEPKLAGRNIHVMISPLPRNKRAPNPIEAEGPAASKPQVESVRDIRVVPVAPGAQPSQPTAEQPKPSGFVNNPFTQLDGKLDKR